MLDTAVPTKAQVNQCWASPRMGGHLGPLGAAALGLVMDTPSSTLGHTNTSFKPDQSLRKHKNLMLPSILKEHNHFLAKPYLCNTKGSLD